MKKLPIHNRTYKAFLLSFKEWLGILGYSRSCIKYSPLYLREFFHWLENHGHYGLDTVTYKVISDYYQYLKQRPNESYGGALSNHTLNNHISAIKRFNEYLKKHNARPLSIHLRSEKTDKLDATDIVSQEEIREMFEAAHHSYVMPHVCLRDRAMLVVLYSCGLRRNEAVHLNLGDVLFGRNRILARRTKNGRERHVPLNDHNMEILEEYIYDGRPIFYKADQTEALFVNQQGGRMGGQSFKLRLRAIIKATGNPELMERRITPHKMRHSIATHLLENGVAIETVSRFLGHSSLESTQVYTHLIKEEL
ncbi:tyrosine-type recombinase/integrase [Spongiimicrobium sp. 3-5]|uniref:tyrosine-type recombinase/integrase n=1 Tax=Spongiimicrobium sp. 3-5 TaxID=3332596 RepID=UPI00397FC9AD